MNDERGLHALMSDMRGKGNLPALDKNVIAICQVARDSNTCAADLTAVILRDVGLTASILTTANSAYYRPAIPIKTVSAAVIFLGFDRVRALALALSIFRLNLKCVKHRELYRLFTGSYFAAMFAMALVHRLGTGSPEEAFVAGLLNQLPRLALANTFPERFVEMERLIVRSGLSRNDACRQVFGIDYALITEGIAKYWCLPANVTEALGGLEGGRSGTVALVREACGLADMLFGNVAGGAQALQECQDRIRRHLAQESFELAGFIAAACEQDHNVSKFFNLTGEDIDMMLKIVQWGKVNPAELAASLTFGSALDDLSEFGEDPQIMLGQFLTELVLHIRRGSDVNEIVLMAQEALYRCIHPAHLFTAFVDGRREQLTGRFYAGQNTVVSARDFVLSMSDQDSLLVRCMQSCAGVQFNPAEEPHALPPGLQQKLKLKYAMAAPIVVFGRSIGLYLVGRTTDEPFSAQETLWLEAVAGHVALAFEHRRDKDTQAEF